MVRKKELLKRIKYLEGIIDRMQNHICAKGHRWQPIPEDKRDQWRECRRCGKILIFDDAPDVL